MALANMTEPLWVGPPAPTAKQMVGMYHDMLRIRLFEQEILAREHEGLAIHSCAGHEAVAVGVMNHLGEHDLVVSNHRPWGHFLAKGGTLKESFAELYGRPDGVCKGMGGEMNLSKPSIGFVQSMMIVGAALTFVCGVGLSIKQAKDRAITTHFFNEIAVCFFGEAASTNGAFNEALTLAKTLELPILFVCENNGLNGNTPSSMYLPTGLVTHRAMGYGFPTDVCDGSDVLAVWEAAQKAVAYVRNERKPYFLECLVSRINRHKVPRMSDIRPDEVKRIARMRDPIPKLRNALIAEGILGNDDAVPGTPHYELIYDIRQEIQEAILNAKR